MTPDELPPSSAAGNGKLRVGLLLDSYLVPEWTYAMIERIVRFDDADVVLLVLNRAPRVRRSFREKVRAYRDTLLYVLYWWLEERFLVPRLRPNAFAQRDIRDLLGQLPVVEVVPRMTRFSDQFADADLERVRAHDLDVLVRLGFRILRGGILSAARHGVWSYHHGDNTVNRGGPAGFWEVFERHPTTGSVLQILTEDLDGGKVIYRSSSATDPWLVSRNRNVVFWKSLDFVPRALHRLRTLGPEAFHESVECADRQPTFYSRRLYTFPTNGEFLRLAGGQLVRYLAQRIGRLSHHEQWQLLYKFSDRLATSLWRFQRIVPPPDRFWADPFVVERDGRYFVFIEEYLNAVGRGHIAVFELDEQGRYSTPVPVLECPHHLSYPYLFEWNGDQYMVPESGAARSVDLYKCTEFPHRWEKHSTILEGLEAADATIFPHDGRWWMFVNIALQEGASTWDELFLYWSEQPVGAPWTPHPQNPVISDVRASRPAGRPFLHDGKLYRPAQDCSRGYGYAIVLNEVVHLTTDAYAERLVNRIDPLWTASITGTHTLNRAGRLTVADIRVRRARFKAHLPTQPRLLRPGHASS